MLEEPLMKEVMVVQVVGLEELVWLEPVVRVQLVREMMQGLHPTNLVVVVVVLHAPNKIVALATCFGTPSFTSEIIKNIERCNDIVCIVTTEDTQKGREIKLSQPAELVNNVS